MTLDPYVVLGVSRSATKDEVKRAYRKLARQYHPDLNPGDSAAEKKMNEINEAYDRIVNPEKYARSDARRGARQTQYSTTGYQGAQGSQGSQNSQGNPYTQYGNPYAEGDGYGWSGGGGQTQWTYINWEDLFNGDFYGQGSSSSKINLEPSVNDSTEIKRAIMLINGGNSREAIAILQDIVSSERNARWNYINAVAQHASGNQVAATDSIRKARNLDPTNQTYIQAERVIGSASRQYREQGESKGFSMGFANPGTLCCCMCIGSQLCSSMLNRFLYFT